MVQEWFEVRVPVTMATYKDISMQWEHHHVEVVQTLGCLLKDAAFVDVTIACKDKAFKAHRLLLSACSNYFSEVLRKLDPGGNPILILPDIGGDIMDLILTFIYIGEVNIPIASLTEFMALAEKLKLKGLEAPSQVEVPLNESPEEEHCSDEGDGQKQASPEKYKLRARSRRRSSAGSRKKTKSEHTSTSVEDIDSGETTDVTEEGARSAAAYFQTVEMGTVIALCSEEEQPPVANEGMETPDAQSVKWEGDSDVQMPLEVSLARQSPSIDQADADISNASMPSSLIPTQEMPGEECIEKVIVDGAPSYLCSVCRKYRTSVKFNALRHMRTHFSVRPYSCQQCGRAYSQSHHLKAHRLSCPGAGEDSETLTLLQNVPMD
ncbi:unnamed protein product [Darwinula stevensoni]|uniref:Uncharacterized protein n=1 Tax=Darwinula stevensoni TaxID=69355 RepID=A0A7R8X3B2_9CRUS|nr:unnamed protein product [Darwinula stevensoni]CAG0882357.1 unnamed protein product [Darwinula stevensoni]